MNGHRSRLGLLGYRRGRRSGGLRVLATTPEQSSGTGTSNRLNTLIEAFGYSRYLEVGVSKGKTLEAVRAEQRVGVDPAPRFDIQRLPVGVEFFPQESDEFFSELSEGDLFDLILIDGLQEFRQSYRDCVASLRHLNAGGLIVVDDVVPSSDSAAIAVRAGVKGHAVAFESELDAWMGDVYKTALALATLHEGLHVVTVVGDGFRPQMVVRRSLHHAGAEPASETSLAALDDLGFREVFDAGIPLSFNPISLEGAVEQFWER